MLSESKLRELIDLSHESKFSGIVKFGEEEFDRILENLKSEGFSGALCISFKKDGKLNSEWLIFSDGELRVIILEKDVASANPEVELIEDIRVREGAAEVLEFSDYVKKIVDEILENYSVKLKPSSQTIQNTKEEDVVTEDREELLKKYRIRINEEDIDFIIGKYRQNDKAAEIIQTMKMSLSGILGKKMAEKIVINQMKKLGIDENRANMKDMEKLLNSVYKAISFQIGKKKAEKLIEDIKSISEVL